MIYKILNKNSFHIFNIIANLLFALVTVFFAAGGHGTYVPFALFFGFFSIPFFISSNFYSFILPIFLQILIYSLMFNFLLKNKKLKYFHLATFCAVGILFALFFCGDEINRLNVYESLIVYLSSLFLVVIYWMVYSVLLRKKSNRN